MAHFLVMCIALALVVWLGSRLILFLTGTALIVGDHIGEGTKMFGFNSFESEVISFFKKILPLDPTRISEIPITEHEQWHINKILEEFGEAYVHKDIADHLERGITAWGIYIYANNVLSRGSEWNEDSKTIDMTKYEDACRSYVKAYFIHPLPMYIFELASILEEMKNVHLAECMY